MTTHMNPYLNFRGEARQALELYQSVFGAEALVNTFREYGGMGVSEEEMDHIMHSQLEIDGSIILMVSDVPSTMPDEIRNGIVSLSGDDDATLRGWWDALAEGGEVHVPLEKAPWGDSFGQLADRFGVTWMVNISGSQSLDPPISACCAPPLGRAGCVGSACWTTSTAARRPPCHHTRLVTLATPQIGGSRLSPLSSGAGTNS